MITEKKYLKAKRIVKKYEKQLNISNPPEPPLCRIIKKGVIHFCNKCESTASRVGFLGLFGERLCDNKNCPNSVSKKIYH